MEHFISAGLTEIWLLVLLGGEGFVFWNHMLLFKVCL